MVGDRYQFDDDLGCYPGTTVLINLAGLRDQDALDQFEIEKVGERSLQPLPEGGFDPKHYCALHCICSAMSIRGLETIVQW